MIYKFYTPGDLVDARTIVGIHDPTSTKICRLLAMANLASGENMLRFVQDGDEVPSFYHSDDGRRVRVKSYVLPIFDHFPKNAYSVETSTWYHWGTVEKYSKRICKW